ncbi:MAG TPA: DUF1015 family protein, partial [Anaerovoracaceae bacterium]|nr:DUF1015 family protein [Anaerovoracaceae bacterium]
MAIVRPFAALRPAKRYAEKVVSLPYDVMNRDEAVGQAKDNPYSFLHISRSEISFPPTKDPYHKDVYDQAKINLDNFVSDGVLIQDSTPCFYIYRQTMKGRIQTGIAACVSIDEYMQDKIKKHEFTRIEKELDRINHFDVCNANTEPVFLTYRHNQNIQMLIDSWIENSAPAYDFLTGDGVGHTLWVIDCGDAIQNLTDAFSQIPYLYIADGHHRSASAVKVGMKQREDNPGYDGSEEFNFFMAVLFPDEDLHIYDYNRVVKDLNKMDDDEFLSKLSKDFIVEQINDDSIRPNSRHVFSMYLNKTWYRLEAKECIISSHPIDGLDVSILQDRVLSPILGIQDPRTDKRIDFVGGIRGLKELEKRVDMDMSVAFALYPVTMDELLAVSDQNEIMPPKSTWFEPKLGSGLFIH